MDGVNFECGVRGEGWKVGREGGGAGERWETKGGERLQREGDKEGIVSLPCGVCEASATDCWGESDSPVPQNV